MPPASPSQPTIPLHEIYATWTTALTLAPTPRLSALRRLISTITSKGTSNIALPQISLSRLFLDLALTYAYLGEYTLASRGFEWVVNANTQRAFALFALGLSQAELGGWEAAKQNWKRCLRCFMQRGGQLKSIPYQPFQPAKPVEGDADVTTRNIGLGEQWLLERERVKWNLDRAAFETGEKKVGISRLGPEDKRHGLNGIPAGFRFGPDGWLNAELERAEAKVFRPLEEIGKPLSSRSSPQSSDPSPTMKSLPPLPPPPPPRKAPALPRVSKVWYVDSPTLGEDSIPEPSSPFPNSASLSSPSAYDSASSIGQNSMGSHPPTSPNSAIATPLSLLFSDGFERDSYDEGSIGGFSGIDEAMALWDLPLDHPIFTTPDSYHAIQPAGYDNEEHDDEEYGNEEYGSEEYGNEERGNEEYGNEEYGNEELDDELYNNSDDDIQGDTTLITDFIPGDIGNQEFVENKGLSLPQNPQSDTGEEILLPRVFEGFGPRM